MRIAILLGVLFIGLTACKKRQVKKVEKVITEGTWKITRFIDSGDDETTSYTGAALVFNSDGTLVLTHGNTYSGSWSVRNDSSSDDDSSDDDLEFVITVPTPHESLSDDWHIVNYSDSKITLEDLDDDEPNKSDYLTLEKI
ncbi:hypothetical protein [Fluviicola taffensis]|uniref:hypothetical protein n=1 Tax=Fluviicola taffensis TaxID=191579 RepID=UPI003138262B